MTLCETLLCENMLRDNISLVLDSVKEVAGHGRKIPAVLLCSQCQSVLAMWSQKQANCTRIA